MNKFALVNVKELSNGDRFYFQSDKSKKAWCFLKKGKHMFRILSNTADRKNDYDRLISESIEIKKEVMVVYLRSSDIKKIKNVKSN